MHLLSAGLAPAKVTFIDFQAGTLALSSNTPTGCLNTIQFLTKIAELISYGWTTTLQVPSHVGIPGNERADQKAKQGVESTQPEVPLTLKRAKIIISTHIDKYTAMTQKTNSFGKPWKTLATVSPIPRHLERAEAVVRLTANEACPLCGHARMDLL
ncbi:reverse transcriptase [Trichonephila clavipes]|nr:reverse transcriptase [Trichonephila clavipes]